MSVSGHKSRASISAYSTTVSDQTKRRMAGVLFTKALGGPTPSAALGAPPQVPTHSLLAPHLQHALLAPPLALPAPPVALPAPPKPAPSAGFYFPYGPAAALGARPPTTALAAPPPDGVLLPYGPRALGAPVSPLVIPQSPNPAIATDAPLPLLDVGDFELSQIINDVAGWMDSEDPFPEASATVYNSSHQAMSLQNMRSMPCNVHTISNCTVNFNFNK